MAETCFAGGNDVMILSCPGASNVGQLPNQAAVELTQEGFGKMFCLAGIGGRLSGFVRSARDVPLMVAIDGCAVGCAKAILKEAQVPMQHYLVLTDEGIEKNGNLTPQRDDVEWVKTAVKYKVGKTVSKASGLPVTGGCGSGCTAC
jgi:uncharacterized metal-binding protein